MYVGMSVWSLYDNGVKTFWRRSLFLYQLFSLVPYNRSHLNIFHQFLVHPLENSQKIFHHMRLLGPLHCRNVSKMYMLLFSLGLRTCLLGTWKYLTRYIYWFGSKKPTNLKKKCEPVIVGWEFQVWLQNCYSSIL